MSFTIVENKEVSVDNILSKRSFEFLSLKTVSERTNILGFYFGSINDVEKVIPLNEGLVEYKLNLYLTHKNILLQLRELNITFPVETVLNLASYVYGIRCSINKNSLLNGFFNIDFNPTIVDRELSKVLSTLLYKVADQLDDSYNFITKDYNYFNVVKRVINEFDEKYRIEYPISFIEKVFLDYHNVLSTSKECPLHNELYRRSVVSFLVENLSYEKGFMVPYIGATIRSKEEFDIEYWNKVYNDFFNCAAFYNWHYETELPKFSTNLSREYKINLLTYVKPEHKLNPLFFGLEDINVAGDEELVFYSDGDHDIVETDSLNNLAKVMINSIKSFKDDYTQAETLFTHEHFIGNESATELWEHILDLIDKHMGVILSALVVFLGAFAAWILNKNLSSRADKLISVIEENKKWEAKATAAFPHEIHRRDVIISTELHDKLVATRNAMRTTGAFKIINKMIASDTEFSTKGMMDIVLNITEGIGKIIVLNTAILTDIEQLCNSTTNENFTTNFKNLEETFKKDEIYKSGFTLAPLFKLCDIKAPIPDSTYATAFLKENIAVTFQKVDIFDNFWTTGTPTPSAIVVAGDVPFIMNPKDTQTGNLDDNGINSLIYKLVSNVNDTGENPTAYSERVSKELERMKEEQRKMAATTTQCKAKINTIFSKTDIHIKSMKIGNGSLSFNSLVEHMLGNGSHIFRLGATNIGHCINLIHGTTQAVGKVANLYSNAIAHYKLDTKAFEEYFNINTKKEKQQQENNK